MGRIHKAAKREARLNNADLAEAEARRRRGNTMRYLYGLSWDEYDAMKEAHAGLCGICGLSPIGRGKCDFLVVDHCHETGKVRGLLCGNCNIAIGLMDDDPAIVRLAAEYLERHRDREPALPRR